MYLKEPALQQGLNAAKSLVYMATVTSTGAFEKYMWLTAKDMEATSRILEIRMTELNLAVHIWRLKDYQEDPEIDWKVVCHAVPFCNLCMGENDRSLKLESATLNQRQDLYNHCRQKRSY